MCARMPLGTGAGTAAEFDLRYVCHDYPPASRAAQWQTTVAEQRARNIRMREPRELQDALSFVRSQLPVVRIEAAP